MPQVWTRCFHRWPTSRSFQQYSYEIVHNDTDPYSPCTANTRPGCSPNSRLNRRIYSTRSTCQNPPVSLCSANFKFRMYLETSGYAKKCRTRGAVVVLAVTLQAWLARTLLQARIPVHSLRIGSLKEALLPQVTHLVAVCHITGNLRIIFCAANFSISLRLNKPTHFVQFNCIQKIWRVC